MQLRNCEGGGLDMRRAGTVCWCSSRTTFGRYGRFLLTALLEMIGTLVRTDHVATHHRPKRALASTPTTPTPDSIKYPSKPERLRQRARVDTGATARLPRRGSFQRSVQLRVARVAAAVV